MIFISHTHADKPTVEPIAQRLASVFGQDNVFYDSWSVQPGEGIIDKMNEALTKCEFFFFFVTKKSITSEMVKLEWQNALFKATKDKIKIIPVKLDNCDMPSVLIQTLYIDAYQHGPENAIRQMIDVISGKNTYRSNEVKGFQNIRGYVSKLDDGSIQIEFRAEAYMEPHSKYLILVENTKDEISYSVVNESQYGSNFLEDVKLSDGTIANGVLLSRFTATTPGFPFIAKLTPKENTEIKFKGLMRAVSQDQFSGVPVIEQ